MLSFHGAIAGSISRHQMVGSINILLAFHGAFAGSISQRLRGKHFSALNRGKHQHSCWHFTALSREAFHSVMVDGKHQHVLAFHSAFAGSISQRHCGREASACAGVSQRFRGKHFSASLWTGSISICWEGRICF